MFEPTSDLIIKTKKYISQFPQQTEFFTLQALTVIEHLDSEVAQEYYKFVTKPPMASQTPSVPTTPLPSPSTLPAVAIQTAVAVCEDEGDEYIEDEIAEDDVTEDESAEDELTEDEPVKEAAAIADVAGSSARCGTEPLAEFETNVDALMKRAEKELERKGMGTLWKWEVYDEGKPHHRMNEDHGREFKGVVYVPMPVTAEGEKIAESFFKKHGHYPSGVTAPTHGPDFAYWSTAVLVPESGDPNWQYAITPKEYEVELKKEFPVLPLKPSFGPTWDDDIMYGVAGDIVRKAAKHCEAHPAGMYLDLLVSLGNLIGRSPYFKVSATHHYANEFVVRVGDTSTSRKGTGRDQINEVLKMVDATWYKECVKNGFGSAEAIVNSIRDDSTQTVRKRATNVFQNISVPGIADKRLMIREGELASIFQLAGKPESRVDIVLRDGWDSQPLNNLVKGKSDGLSNSASCQFPHISISADTTRNELIAKMPKGAESNGFGNRFLYCYVQRVKLCPDGGPDINWAPELIRLTKAIQFARNLKHVASDDAARQFWTRMYLDIEEEQQQLSGLAKSMTDRAAAHIRRLALILFLLDGEQNIDGEQKIRSHHVKAAKRIWDFCQDSARFIFGGLTKDQETILTWLQMNGPATLPQITQKLFHKNRKSNWVRLQVNGLVAANKVTYKDRLVSLKT